MENTNSAPLKKKKFFPLHGKKKKVFIVIAVLLLAGFIGRGFAFRSASGAAWGNRSHSLNSIIPQMQSRYTAIAAKDFEPLGIVFAETIGGRRNGYGATYDALIKAAAQKGADAIINVNIATTGVFFNRTWSGSALAIKYLDAVTGEIATPVLLTRGGRRFFSRN